MLDMSSESYMKHQALFCSKDKCKKVPSAASLFGSLRGKLSKN